jgi:putrescine transport system ATP-binding protein
MADAPLLAVEGVSKSFGPVVAVDRVSLTVGRGEFFALLGPSGCGKTTLLRMLAGFETPEQGRILIDGVDVTATPPHARPVNMMFQSYALFPHMSVAQNIAFGLRQEGMARERVRARVEEMLELVQLQGYGARRPHQLSGGQKQRVALARALAKAPRLLLLDEPLAALDRKLREQTQFELVRIQERVGLTFIIVTHDQGEAMSMASRIAVMAAGRIEQLGPPRAVYEQPASRFVADFIGTVNLIAGRVLGADGGEIALDGGELGGLRIVGTAPVGSELTLALRPERISLHRAAPAAAANCVAGRLAEIAYQGGFSLYRIELPSGTVLRASRANSAEGEGVELERGAAVWLSWPAAAPTVLPK